MSRNFHETDCLTLAEQHDNCTRGYVLALSVLRETRAKVAEMTKKVKDGKS